MQGFNADGKEDAVAYPYALGKGHDSTVRKLFCLQKLSGSLPAIFSEKYQDEGEMKTSS